MDKRATSIDLGTITLVQKEIATSEKTFTINLLGEVVPNNRQRSK